MKRLVALGFVLLVCSSCLFKGSPGATGNLTQFAMRADKLTYEAIYSFAISGQLAGGVSARLEIAQSPPAVLRRLDTTSKPSNGNPITLSSWFVSNASGHYSCAQYGGATRCSQDNVASTAFGDAQIDGFFDLPRQADAFASARKDTRPVRIHGEKGTCFEAAPAAPSEPPVHSPQPTVLTDRYDYQLCYSDDGILLRGRRTNLTAAEAGGPTQDYVLEVISISRVVQPSDVRLPGPLVSPEELHP
jgi:hypothetical protein